MKSGDRYKQTKPTSMFNQKTSLLKLDSIFYEYDNKPRVFIKNQIFFASVMSQSQFILVLKHESSRGAFLNEENYQIHIYNKHSQIKQFDTETTIFLSIFIENS